MSVAIAGHAPDLVRPRIDPVPVVRSSERPAGTTVIDALLLLGVVVCIPFAMMLFGLPIVLVLQLILRLVRLA